MSTNGLSTKKAAPKSRIEVPEFVAGSAATINLPALEMREIRCRIVGTAPLVVHRQGAKYAEGLAAGQGIIPKQGRKAKNPVEDFLDTIYRIDGTETLVAVDENDVVIHDYKGPNGDGLFLDLSPVFAKFETENNHGFGFPAHAFREGLIRSGGLLDIAPMTRLRCMFSVPRIMCLIDSPNRPQMRFDSASVQGKADLRFRGQFNEWTTTLSIRFCPQIITETSVLNLLRMAGIACGIGEMRPEKKVGTFGTYTFDNVHIVKVG